MEEIRSQQRRLFSKRDRTDQYNRKSDYGSLNSDKRIEMESLLPESRKGKSPLPQRHSDIKLSPDEFEEADISKDISNNITRTGRQRKKLAARTKGGEFQAQRKKRRVYFCCISSEIDLEKLQDAIHEHAQSSPRQWTTKMYEDVVHLYISDDTEPAVSGSEARRESVDMGASPPQIFEGFKGFDANDDAYKRMTSVDSASGATGSVPLQETPSKIYQSAAHLWAGCKELFVFEFGVCVFWGFARGEEEQLVLLIRKYVEQGLLTPEECKQGQDDMAFVTSYECGEQMEIANDVITLPEDFRAKDRLSASFAIAQSAVLNVFEARIESRVNEYKYIPETLALSGKLKLSPKMLNTMIGEVYRIRHDVNLHTEILDTPDFFWKEEKRCEDVYKLVCRYLEMTQRTEVLNKRLDMFRDLLGVLQQQQENSSAMKLEWIVIWLIVISVVVESAAIAVEILKK